MFEFLRMIVASVAVFAILVFVHEMGHYLAARYCKIKVDVFSIGFGTALKGWYDKSGTEWRLSAFPLGGYVRLHGFEKPDTSEEAEKLVPGSAFFEKSVFQRMLVVSMGPIFNFILAIILFSIIFSCSGKFEARPDVGSILPNSPAASSGLKVGDHLLRVAGTPVTSVEQIQKFIISHSDQAISFEVKRGEEKQNILITPKVDKENGQNVARIGVAFTSARGNPVPIYKAVPLAVEETWNQSAHILSSLWEIVTGQRSTAELGGTIRIVQMSGEVASYGLVSLLSFMALLSINLGLLNLLPVPALDGGRLVFYAIEGIIRRPIPDRVRDIYLQIGIALILLLFILSTYNDLRGIGVFSWFYKIFVSITH
ncbi:RIP metalloprotease RseP [Acetobacteraceae bacterium]|nr:RIP metalloprotease RseP [Acetobacteraceae bacterium]